MPGQGSYGPAGKWVHDRAHGIMEDGKTPKDVAYAVATQQAHKVGKSPKDFRTPSGVHEAKMKYDSPKSEYQKTAMLTAFFDELEKISQNPGMSGALKSSDIPPGGNPMGGSGSSGGSGNGIFDMANQGMSAISGGNAAGPNPAATASGRMGASQQAGSTIGASTPIGNAKPMKASDLGI